MKNVLLALCLVIALSRFSPAQTVAQKTAAPDSSRYEIVMSGIAAKVLLKLDKYYGDVYQLVLTKDDKLKWQTVSVLPDKRDINPSNQKVNYQIFTSGITIRDTILLNVNTGLTWVLIEDTAAGELFWRPIN